MLSLVSEVQLEFNAAPQLMHAVQAPDSVVGVAPPKNLLLSKEVSDLLCKRAIESAPAQIGFYAHIFLVLKKNGKMRLVFNMKPLNRFISARSFKMATLKMVVGALRKDDFVVSLDLLDTYFHLRIDPNFRRFFRFKFWGKFFQFRAMLFGLCSTPHVFTMLTRAITRFCRSRGIRIIFYLDDTIIMACSRALALQHRDFVMSLLGDLGFLNNLAKSDLAPSRSFCFLGLNWDTPAPSVSLTDEKIATLSSSAQRLLSKVSTHCREIQQFLGHTNFTAFAVPRARLNSRALQVCLSRNYKSPIHLFRSCPLSEDAHRELTWWVSLSVASKPLHAPLPSVFITTDASKQGGAVWDHRSVSGSWDISQSHHINWLELQAIFLALKHWALHLHSKVVAIQSNNCTVVSYIRKRGRTRSRDLMTLTWHLLALADRWGITLRPSYIPGLLNVEADALSRGKKSQGWHLLPWMA